MIGRIVKIDLKDTYFKDEDELLIAGMAKLREIIVGLHPDRLIEFDYNGFWEKFIETNEIAYKEATPNESLDMDLRHIIYNSSFEERYPNYESTFRNPYKRNRRFSDGQHNAMMDRARRRFRKAIVDKENRKRRALLLKKRNKYLEKLKLKNERLKIDLITQMRNDKEFIKKLANQMGEESHPGEGK